jgi:mRNA interferase MazF
MGKYQGGDVILAPVALDNRCNQKIRPAVVITCDDKDTVLICPVSSKPPSDAPSFPVGLNDFSVGGLDLFGESHVLTSRVLCLRIRDIVGKKGRLTREAFSEVAAQVPPTALLKWYGSIPLAGKTRKENIS